MRKRRSAAFEVCVLMVHEFELVDDKHCVSLYKKRELSMCKLKNKRRYDHIYCFFTAVLNSSLCILR